MIFNIFGSNDTIIIVNQTNIGGSSQSNTLLLSGLGLGYGAAPVAAPARGVLDSYNGYNPHY